MDEEEEAYVQFQASQKRLQEARQQINKHRTGRNFFGPRGGSRGDGRQGPCLKCGGDRRAGACPDKSDPKLGDKRSEGVPFNGLVRMAEGFTGKDLEGSQRSPGPADNSRLSDTVAGGNATGAALSDPVPGGHASGAAPEVHLRGTIEQILMAEEHAEEQPEEI